MNELEQRLKELREQYFQKLPARVAEMRTSFENWQASSMPADLEGLKHVAHTLAGSGTTFGLQRVSLSAMLLERLVDSIMDPESRVLSEHSSQLNELIQELAEIGLDPHAYSQKGPGSIKIEFTQKQASQLALVEDDTEYSGFLKQQLLPFGYQLHCFSSLAELIQRIEHIEPSVVLLDIYLRDNLPISIEQIDTFLAKTNHSIPMLFISAKDSLETRLHAVNKGSAGFMKKPIHLDRLLERLDELSHSAIEQPYRVLIVDDDSIMAQHFKLVLESSNIKTQIVSQAEKFLEVVNSFEPELILMDLNLGAFDGIHLARVIEQHESYFNLPIVFLSTQNDLQKRLQAFTAGGENFLTKPVSSAMLLASVYTRVRRARQTSNRMRREGMTGLLTHAVIVDVLNSELTHSQKEKKAFSITFLDFDHFKVINDSYGHQAGDMVIRRFARLLKSAGFGYDLAGRYGGEEFLLLFPDMLATDSLTVIEDLRQQFRQIEFYTAEEELFHCNFSAGVAQADNHCSAQQLIAWADQALYEAKKNGRNQSRVYQRI